LKYLNGYFKTVIALKVKNISLAVYILYQIAPASSAME